MSDIENSSSSSEFEGMDRDFTPVNPEARIKTPEKPDAGSKSKAKANSFAQDVKAKAKAKVWDAMHDEKALEKSTAKAINRDKAMQPPKSKPKKNPYLMTEAKAASSSSSRPKANPFILDEAKGASTKSKPKKAPSPHSEDDDDDDESSVELQLKDITNRNKTTVATLREALSVRGLHTKGNRCDVTARFLLYELGLDTTGRDTAMHEYCKKLLGAPMPRLKDTLKDLGQNDVGTNKPQLATRILKATYSAEGDSEQEDKEKEEEDESSSEEGDDGSDQEGPEKTSATPSTSPSSVANGKKRVRVDAEDLDEEEVTPKRQKVVAPNDENEEPSRNQAKVEKPPTLGKPKLTSTTNKSNGVLKMAKPTDDNKKQKRRRSAEADDHDNNPQLQQTKKQKLTEPPKSSKPKDNNNKITAAEIGREVRAKPIPSTLKPKAVAKGSKGKSKKDHDNYFTFAGSLDSRILFENQPVPAQVLDSALRVLTAMGTYKDINAVHVSKDVPFPPFCSNANEIFAGLPPSPAFVQGISGNPVSVDCEETTHGLPRGAKLLRAKGDTAETEDSREGEEGR